MHDLQPPNINYKIFTMMSMTLINLGNLLYSNTDMDQGQYLDP